MTISSIIKLICLRESRYLFLKLPVGHCGLRDYVKALFLADGYCESTDLNTWTIGLLRYASLINLVNVVVCLIGAAAFARMSAAILGVVLVCLSAVIVSYLAQPMMEVSSNLNSAWHSPILLTTLLFSFTDSYTWSQPFSAKWYVQGQWNIHWLVCRDSLWEFMVELWTGLHQWWSSCFLRVRVRSFVQLCYGNHGRC